ncbi:MAG: beta-ketoacyl-[acyl-carrier-protein] synthase family protein [Bacteroidetes bacterium]|nr:beta-ketoacyl-[acyl-carrier-protein] synthase family protein [Bacteroidota bacterium]
MKKKVVITAINTINSLGLNIDECWNNLIDGKSGIKRISRFDPSDLETQIAAELPNEFEEYASEHVKKRSAKQMTRVTKMGLVCAKEAVTRYNFNTENYPKDRVAVLAGVVNTGFSSIEKANDDKNSILKAMNNSLSAWISLEYGFTGPNFSVATACASSAYAMALGFDMIANNQADAVIVVSSDSVVNPEEIKGFNEIYALSTSNDRGAAASCPFSKDRDGFVIGEGAGAIILESEEGARARGANILAEFAGYGLSSEAYNIVSPQEGGEGMMFTMQKALKHAGLKPEDIHHINAHGTSTTLNDMYETMAVKKLFGDNASKIPVVSSKSMIGHTIGAAGVIEGAITVKSLLEQKLHPTANYINPDPELDLDYVPNIAREHEMSCALSNSFGFGGHNATLVFKSYI